MHNTSNGQSLYLCEMLAYYKPARTLWVKLAYSNANNVVQYSCIIWTCRPKHLCIAYYITMNMESLFPVSICTLPKQPRQPICRSQLLEISNCRFTVTERLTHLAATLEVMGSPQPRRYLWDLFFRIDTVSGTEGLKMACVTLWNLLWPAMSAMLTDK